MDTSEKGNNMTLSDAVVFWNEHQSMRLNRVKTQLNYVVIYLLHGHDAFFTELVNFFGNNISFALAFIHFNLFRVRMNQGMFFQRFCFCLIGLVLCRYICLVMVHRYS